jgi:DNA-binding SARP family transcriptional activator
VGTWTRLFGRFELGLDGVAAPASARAGSLLAYLLLRHDAPQPRERVAALFWPESTAAQARTNLRHLLHTLRGTVPGERLSITPRTVRWLADGSAPVDVVEFERLLGRHDDVGAERHRAVREAVALYRGDLLEGYAEEWVLAERDRLRRRYLDALAELARLGMGRGDLAEAVPAAERLVRDDPLREEGYRLLMRLYEARGERARALAVFHDCSSTLERELGVPPSPRTRAVYAALLPGGETAGPAMADRAALVGRDAERAGLAEAWRSAEARQARLVLVGGEPGVGKTRLVEELRAWCARRGAVVADARCYGVEGTLAYGPVADWLRSPALRPRLPDLSRNRLTELIRLLPELAGELPGLANPDPLPEAEQRRRVFDAVAAAVLDRASPVLLVVDDLHHADPETCGFLHYVMRARPQAKLLVVATARRGEIDDDHPVRRLLTDLRTRQRLVEIELAPLVPAETALLAERLTGRRPAAAEARRLHEETEGNPLFVVEAVRAGWPDESTTSPRVQAVIEARLDRLRGPARELVEVAALVGREFRAAVLAAATTLDEDTLVASLDELWRRRIVRERGAGGYDFSHDKIREVAAAAISPARRGLLHRRIAAALEATTDHAEQAGEIAAHHEAAGAAGQAASWYRRAAEVAQVRAGGRPAAVLFERSLAALRGLPGSPDRDAAELAIRTARLPALAAAQGYASPELAANQRRARELCASLGHDPAPALLRSLAMTASATADFGEGMRIGRRLLATAERTGDAVLLVEAAFVLGVTAFWEAEFGTARRHLELAVERYRPADRGAHLLHYGNDPKVSCLSRLGNTLWFLGEPDAARAARDAAVAWAEEIEHGYSRGIALWFSALLAMDSGDTDRLRADAAALATASDAVQFHLATTALRGYLAVRDGSAAAGIADVRATIARARGEEAPGLLASLYRILLAACVTAGDAPGAVAVAERLVTMGAGARVWAAEARRVLEAFRAPG